MDLNHSVTRLQDAQPEFRQEQTQTNKQMLELFSMLNSKFDNMSLITCSSPFALFPPNVEV